jgi:hypothetical protein
VPSRTASTPAPLSVCGDSGSTATIARAMTSSMG